MPKIQPTDLTWLLLYQFPFLYSSIASVGSAQLIKNNLTSFVVVDFLRMRAAVVSVTNFDNRTNKCHILETCESSIVSLSLVQLNVCMVTWQKTICIKHQEGAINPNPTSIVGFLSCIQHLCPNHRPLTQTTALDKSNNLLCTFPKDMLQTHH